MNDGIPTKMGKGGKREGAGRKALPPREKAVQYTIRINPQVIDWLARSGGRPFAAAIIEAAFNQQDRGQ